MYMCMFKIHLHIRSSVGVLLAPAISTRSPAPSSARCDTVKTFPTKAIFRNVAISSAIR